MKIRAVKARILREVLLKLGFEEETARDHVFYFYRYRGKIVSRTKTSHGVAEIRQPILGVIGKQLHLDREEFENFLQGALPARAYEAILRRKGIITIDTIATLAFSCHRRGTNRIITARQRRVSQFHSCFAITFTQRRGAA